MRPRDCESTRREMPCLRAALLTRRVGPLLMLVATGLWTGRATAQEQSASAAATARLEREKAPPSVADGGASSDLPQGGSPTSVVEAQPAPADNMQPGVANLPPVEPEAAIGAVESEKPPAPETRSIPKEDRPEAVVGVILALLALMALAYLGGHRRVLAWEKRLGISQVITAGLPFIALGMIARLPSVGILTDPVLIELSPLLRIGLGSVGFVAGFRFDARLFQGLPRGTASIAFLSTLMPALTVTVATAPLLLVFSGAEWASVRDPVFVRDALLLATAGAMTARSAIRMHEELGKDSVGARIIRLEELAGVAGLALVASFFREAGGWQLPGMMWLLLTIGLGTALGLLFYAILAATPRGPDFLAVTLGAIAFVAGAAGYVHLSSVAVAFVAGVILANFPGTFQQPLRDMLKRIERPIYLLALIVIGALWNVADWRGWVLMPVFMVARLAGKWLASVIAARDKQMPITPEEGRTLAISPLGALAIAIVVNAQLLYPGGSISLVVSAVIGGGVLTEAFVQFASRRSRRRLGLAGGSADDEQDAVEVSNKVDPL